MSLGDLIDLKIKNRMRDTLDSINTINLGVIVAFYPETMRADIKMLENLIGKDGVEYESPIILECPVMYPNSGAFEIRVPYKEGDKVVVGFCDSSIDDVTMSGLSQVQRLSRRLSETDAVVLYGWRCDNCPTVEVETSEDLLIKNKDTGNKIVFKANGDLEMNVKNITVNCEDTVVNCKNSTVNATSTTINASDNSINGNLKVSGTVDVDGAVTSKSSVKAPNLSASSSLTVKGKEMSEHTHGGVSTGNGTTGAPV